jgi:dienelactone hydrolase
VEANRIGGIGLSVGGEMILEAASKSRGLKAVVSEGAGERSPTYYEAAGQPKSIWQVPGSGHVAGIDAQPQQYEERVIGFFDRTLLDRE